MLTLALKALLYNIRRTMLCILTIAFLVTAITAPLALGNGYSEQISSMIPPVQGRYLLIMNSSARSLSDSRLDYSISQAINRSNIEYLMPYVLFEAELKSPQQIITVRGIEPQEFYEARHVNVEGVRIGQSNLKANVGWILAQRWGLKNGQLISFIVDGQEVSLEIVGILTSHGPMDSELIITIEDAWLLNPKLKGMVSALELCIQDSSRLSETSSQLETLSGIKVIPQQQLTTIAPDFLRNTLNTIQVWSMPIYLLVFAAIYVISLRITRESEWDVAMLRALGFTKRQAAIHLLNRILLMSIFGASLGIAIGLSGSQIAARLASLAIGVAYETPFLELIDTFQIFLYTQLAAILGALHPTIRTARRSVVEIIR